MKKTAVLLDGELTIHLPHTDGNYYTLCGLDGMDEEVGQAVADVPKGAKVNCKQCYWIWKVSKEFRLSDFVTDIENAPQ